MKGQMRATRAKGSIRKLLLRTAAPALLLGAAACAGDDVAYRPTPQILPQHISRIAIRPVINKTQQFGLEDKLTLRIRDEFLRDGRYPLVPESNADGLVLVTLKRYILTPTQYDSVLTPTAYKLIVLANLDFVDRTTNTILWSEPNLEGIQSFTASTLKGGITEEQARELVWDVLARVLVKRTVEGFGAVTGASQRQITGDAPPGQEAPKLPTSPFNPNPY